MAVALGATLALASPAAAQTLYQFDSATTSTVPSNAQAVAGYLNGSWPTYRALLVAFPHARHLPITVQAIPIKGYPVVCLDSEPDNPPASSTGPWAKKELALGVHPCVYSMLSWMPAIRASLAAAGVSRAKVLLWDADWTFIAHIDVGFDGTQFTNHALNRNLDESEMSTAFYAALRTTVPKDGLCINVAGCAPKSKLVKCLGKKRTKAQCEIAWADARDSTLRALKVHGCATVSLRSGKVVAVLVRRGACATLEQRAAYFARLARLGQKSSSS